jgi:hypothetical protein
MSCLESGKTHPDGLWHECELKAKHGGGLHRCPCGVHWQSAEDDPGVIENDPLYAGIEPVSPHEA